MDGPVVCRNCGHIILTTALFWTRKTKTKKKNRNLIFCPRTKALKRHLRLREARLQSTVATLPPCHPSKPQSVSTKVRHEWDEEEARCLGCVWRDSVVGSIRHTCDEDCITYGSETEWRQLHVSLSNTLSLIHNCTLNKGCSQDEPQRTDGDIKRVRQPHSMTAASAQAEIDGPAFIWDIHLPRPEHSDVLSSTQRLKFLSYGTSCCVKHKNSRVLPARLDIIAARLVDAHIDLHSRSKRQTVFICMEQDGSTDSSTSSRQKGRLLSLRAPQNKTVQQMSSSSTSTNTTTLKSCKRIKRRVFKLFQPSIRTCHL